MSYTTPLVRPQKEQGRQLCQGLANYRKRRCSHRKGSTVTAEIKHTAALTGARAAARSLTRSTLPSVQVLLCSMQLIKLQEPGCQASSYCSCIVHLLCFCIIHSSAHLRWCQLTGHICEKLPNHTFSLPNSTTERKNNTMSYQS